MKGRWESNINVWFRLIYSQKWNCRALLFPKQKYNVLSPNFYIHVSVSNYIYTGSVCLFCCSQIGLPIWKYINRSQKHECRNWERGRAVLFLGIHKSDFRYSAECSECTFSVTYHQNQCHPQHTTPPPSTVRQLIAHSPILIILVTFWDDAFALASIFLYATDQGWAKLVLIALERYSVALKRLTFNLR